MKKHLITSIIMCMHIFFAGVVSIPVYSSSATSMDVNDFESTMSVGGSQTISVVLYPEDAEDTVKYSSSNTSVATISQGGKISAKSVGRTNITVTAGSVTQTMQLTVESVTIEVSEFENKMDVGTSQTITVTLHPSNATDKISYASSDESVATISKSGKIEAKSAGKTKITVSAGGASKTMSLTVSVGTKSITLNSTFITLNPGETYKLKGEVSPSNANQKLTYKSSDTSVAKVSSNGTIKAVGLGSTSILVSNGDMTTSADVIVNSSTARNGSMYFGNEDPNESKTEEKSDLTSDKIDAKRLKTLQKTGNTLTIEKDDYVITLKGSDIVNTENGLDEELHIAKSDDGYTFSIVGGTEFLPGNITIRFKDKDMQKCKYVYLLDTSNDKYQLFGELTNSGFKTDVAGSYRITYEKLKREGPDKNLIVITIGAFAAFAAGCLVYRRLL